MKIIKTSILVLAFAISFYFVGCTPTEIAQDVKQDVPFTMAFSVSGDSTVLTSTSDQNCLSGLKDLDDESLKSFDFTQAAFRVVTKTNISTADVQVTLLKILGGESVVFEITLPNVDFSSSNPIVLTLSDSQKSAITNLISDVRNNNACMKVVTKITVLTGTAPYSSSGFVDMLFEATVNQ